MHGFDWNDLRYFLALYRRRTLAGAARELRVQHSTVGRRLAALEEALGASLFTQAPDGFVPTEAGLAIVPLAEDAERAVQAIDRRISGSDARIAGMVRLTTSEAFSGLIVRHLGRLRDRFPDLTVEVLAGNRSLDLARGEADLALRFTETTDPNLICKRVGSTAWSIYAALSYVERRGLLPSATDFRGHDVIGFDETLAAVPGALWLAEHGAGSREILRGNSIVAILNAAIVGMGVAILPCFIAEAEPTLRRLTPDIIGSREVWLVFHPDAARIARVRSVIDFVTETMAAEADRLGGTAAPVPAPLTRRA
ncbi:MAG TPA: LysR family transcriptional regulator [Bauldia sp.]|nr:LysR family transcriptional regulator [Bauldia sp.]